MRSKSAEAAARAPQTAPQTVLVLQGGGALGAYQGGVFETLAGHGFATDWVVGTSIGAINGAIIAGNRPEHRLERLREFWRVVSQDTPLSPFAGNPLLDGNPLSAWLAPWLSASNLWTTITRGIPGFFEPRRQPGWFDALPFDITRQVPTHDASFYDTSPLRATLERLIDFRYLNEKHVRCTVCAVEVASGQLRTYKLRRMEDVQVLDQPCVHPVTEEHLDLFGMTGPAWLPVELHLTGRACGCGWCGTSRPTRGVGATGWWSRWR